jgi:hypothetical protein
MFTRLLRSSDTSHDRPQRRFLRFRDTDQTLACASGLQQLLESDETPHTLTQHDVELICGSLFGEPCMAGLVSYFAAGHLRYRREDGRVLHFHHTGELTYTLDEEGPL